MSPRSTGIGSLPGTDCLDAAHLIAGECPGLLHLAELPARGPGADMIGRTGALLAGITPDLALETVPRGWRTTAGPGREMRRARAWLDEDLDRLEETAHEFAGDLKVQVCGPWTFAASVELPSGERLLSDAGACRDLAEALADAAVEHVRDVRRRMPSAASIMVQFDEPSLPSVLAGSVGTASGLSRYAAVDPQVVSAALARIASALRADGAMPGMHCCASRAPIDLLRGAGAEFISIDLLVEQDEEQIGAAWESGAPLLLGSIPSMGEGRVPDTAVSAPIRALAERLGLDGRYEGIVVTPSCGMAGASPAWVRTAYAAVRGAAHVLRENGDHADE